MYNHETNISVIVLDPTLYIGMTAPQNPTCAMEKHNFQYFFLNSASSESFYNQCLLAMNRLAMKIIIKRLLPIYGNPENPDSGGKQWGFSEFGPFWVQDTTDPKAIQRYVINMIIQGERDLHGGWWSKNKGAAKIALGLAYGSDNHLQYVPLTGRRQNSNWYPRTCRNSIKELQKVFRSLHFSPFLTFLTSSLILEYKNLPEETIPLILEIIGVARTRIDEHTPNHSVVDLNTCLHFSLNRQLNEELEKEIRDYEKILQKEQEELDLCCDEKLKIQILEKRKLNDPFYLVKTLPLCEDNTGSLDDINEYASMEALKNANCPIHNLVSYLLWVRNTYPDDASQMEKFMRERIIIAKARFIMDTKAKMNSDYLYFHKQSLAALQSSQPNDRWWVG